MSQPQAKQSVPIVPTVLATKHSACSVPPALKALSANIKALMAKHNTTYNQLGIKINVPVNTIKEWGAGRAFPSGDRLQRLAQALKSTPARMIR